MLKLAMGIAVLAVCIGVGFIPMTAETYQHIRLWSHTIWGAAIAIGVVLTVSGLIEA